MVEVKDGNEPLFFDRQIKKLCKTPSIFICVQVEHKNDVTIPYYLNYLNI